MEQESPSEAFLNHKNNQQRVCAWVLAANQKIKHVSCNWYTYSRKPFFKWIYILPIRVDGKTTTNIE